MFGAIPNPKKTISIDKPLSVVKDIIPLITQINPKYKSNSTNEILNLYTLEATEFLSLGVYIDIALSSQSENKTEINVEIKRKVGSFDQSHEVNKANEHIKLIFEAIGNLLQKNEAEINQLKEQQKTAPASAAGKGKGCMVIAIPFITIGLYLISLAFR
jgi:hypothetical protein